MKLTGAQILCESLLKEGVDVVFGYPGGQVLPLYHTLTQYPQLRHILVRHEQGAVHAADAYARVTGRVGVCFATSGPGATNLITGLANAYMDSIPMVAVTGQVPRAMIGRDAFQESDITGITIPITKHNYLVMDVADLAKTVKEAFYIASTGRPGPVLIDLPRDIQQECAEFHFPARVNLPGYKPTLGGNPLQIKKAVKLLGEAKKPVIIAGHGVRISRAYKELKFLAETLQIPVLTTLLGISGFPESNPLSFGMIGMHGLAPANMAITNSDLVVAIGMRFDDRATGKISSFAPHAKVIHIDIDPAEIGKNVAVDVPIVGDVKTVLVELNKEIGPVRHDEWLTQLSDWKKQYPSGIDIRESETILPQYVIRKIWEATKGNATVVTGVGQHQMFAALHYYYDKPNSYITSGGLGTMGFELPAAFGAQVGLPDETIWCIAGDGSIQMTIQELGTIRQENSPVKIAILNNGFLGMVRQWQELFYQHNYSSTPLWCPDFIKIAEAYGIPAQNVTRKEDVGAAIKKAMETEGPYILNFVVEPEENVYPMVPPGAGIDQILHEPLKEAC
ncbi:acetolactate synthase, large subunit [Dehalogenimonas formicexedens]|uniref:Acetolactate synthase n=1 Tax=Dehalogenimonas formicexedens TaxID=1839801 RepID=A0A1P8F6H1_9CHLR|nr:biosynthetic-type acetolactate synthase large subunit [Dehalogenimonas formicexedens]APV44081.1 acetolactate synthase, large subunit [Dehalogenimonas formicexedens]